MTSSSSSPATDVDALVGGGVGAGVVIQPGAIGATLVAFEPEPLLRLVKLE